MGQGGLQMEPGYAMKEMKLYMYIGTRIYMEMT